MNTRTYYSFADYAESEFKSKPLTGRTRDMQKLKAQREKFLGICPYCKCPNKFIYGTNVIACANEKCEGKTISITNDDGTETVKHIPFTKLLSEKGMEIGNVLFDE